MRLIYKVYLKGGTYSRPKRDVKFVRASSKEKAIESAKANSIVFRNGKCSATAHEACPVGDLRCTPKAELFTLFDNMRGITQ